MKPSDKTPGEVGKEHLGQLKSPMKHYPEQQPNNPGKAIKVSPEKMAKSVDNLDMKDFKKYMQDRPQQRPAPAPKAPEKGPSR